MFISLFSCSLCPDEIVCKLPPFFAFPFTSLYSFIQQKTFDFKIFSKGCKKRRDKNENGPTFFAHVLIQGGENGVGFAVSEESGDRGVDGILVLLEPAGDRVGDRASIVVQVEMSLGFALGRLWLAEVRMLAQVVVVELLLEGLVGRLGHNALLLEDGEYAERLLDQVDAGLQVEAEVHHLPLDALLLVLLLLEHEHVMVEELLEALVRVVDADLLESVVL